MSSSEDGGSMHGFNLAVTIVLCSILWSISFAIIVANPFAAFVPSIQLFLIACVSFLIGISAQIFFGKRRIMKIGIAGGFAVSIGAWLVGGIIVLISLIMLYVLDLAKPPMVNRK